jgi:hybrid polyketide synthase/nonribosomal peptide synthetase ACE1
LLPVSFRRQPNQPFSSAIAEARSIAYAALGMSRLPFDVMLTELKVERSSAHNPLFQAFLNYRQGAQEKHTWGDCELEFQEGQFGRTAYDITLDVGENAKDAVIMFRVQKGLYDLQAANLLLQTFVHLLDFLTAQPSATLDNTPLFSGEQLQKAVTIGRGTYPQRVCRQVQSSSQLMRIFQAQA